MIITDEVSREAGRLPSAGRRNVEGFFDRFSLDRSAFEAFSLRRFPDTATPYYVSTVARGLAGSTSDIDLILVSPDKVPPEQASSNMLFFGDRRVGVKLISRADIDQALAGLDACGPDDGGPLDLGTDPTSAGPIRWVDLERVVNGVSFQDDAGYTRHLPTLSRAAVQRFLAEFQIAAACTGLACVSGAEAAAYAYRAAAVVAAMDALMAACGRVQWNMKWTLERWRRFAVDATTAEARLGVAAIEKVAPIIQAIAPSSTADPLDELRRFFEANVLARRPLPAPRLALATDARTFGFLPGATAVERAGAFAVTDAALAAHIAASGEIPSDPERARAALQLLQLGFLRMSLDGGVVA